MIQMDELIKIVNEIVKKHGYSTVLHLLTLLNNITCDKPIKYLFDIQYIRKWIYTNLPRYGLNFTDVDLLVNKYSTNGNIKDEKIMFIEFKHGITPYRLRKDQRNPFHIIDMYLQDYNNYYGFHVITLDNYNLDNVTKIFINNYRVTVNEFKDFLMFKARYSSYFKD